MQLLEKLRILSRLNQKKSFLMNQREQSLNKIRKQGTEVIPSETDLVFTVSKGKEMRTLDNLVGFDEDELTEL